MTMTDIVIGAEWPGFKSNSLTGPGIIGARRNAEPRQIINVCTHSTVRLKPCTMQRKETYKEVNKKERNGKKLTAKMMVASGKRESGDRRGRRRGIGRGGALTPSARRC